MFEQKFIFSIKNNSKKEFKVEYDFKKLQIFLFLKQNINSADLYNHLFKVLANYSNLDIDLNSFIEFNFTNIDHKSLSLIILSIVEHYNNFPILYKTTKIKKKKLEILNLEKIDKEMEILVKNESIAKKLQELPPNVLNPNFFVDEIKKIFKNEMSKIEILNETEIKKEKLNLLYEVGKSTKNNTFFVIIKLISDVKFHTIGVIGKGVCYDSGGMNIKTGSFMSGMKFDMSGAAVAVGLASALKNKKLNKNIIFFIPIVENLINETSYKPDDVIISYSGKTVEITNTDAEGRLIMADALSYAHKKYNVKELISIATLTGSIGYSLGYKYSGVWSTKDENWKKIKLCSNLGAEFIWRMPLDNYYLKGLESVIADISNSSKTGAGGACRAAMFLKEFTNNLPYTHIDIANVAHLENHNIARAPILRTLYFYFSN